MQRKIIHMEASNGVREMNISVIIPMHNGAATIGRCLEALAASNPLPSEIIVVDDSSTDESPAIAGAHPVKVITLEGGSKGPAYARNQGAAAAAGDILAFIDADVLVHPDTLTEITGSFARYAEFDAVFGSYDDQPGPGEFLSQYKNLSHHFVHQAAQQEGQTFWAGCGAIHRKVFMAVGGFDAERYPRPSIEDIELGYRMRAAGHRILVDKGAQVTHLKRWTLVGWLKTDIFDRALPWTSLIFQEKDLPDDLNLEASQRASAIILALMLLSLMLTGQHWLLAQLAALAGLAMLLLSSCNLVEGERFTSSGFIHVAATAALTFLLGASAGYLNQTLLLALLAAGLVLFLLGRLLPICRLRIKRNLFAMIILGLLLSFVEVLFASPAWMGMVVIAALAVIVVLNRRMYSFFLRKRGLFFALGAIPFHLFYYLYSLLAFALGGAIHFWNTKMKIRK